MVSTLALQQEGPGFNTRVDQEDQAFLCKVGMFFQCIRNFPLVVWFPPIVQRH